MLARGRPETTEVMLTDIPELIRQAGEYISSHQLRNGAIPWYPGGKTDPWDHTECAIALDLCGRHADAARAYRWLKDIQNPDGSWWYSYVGDQPYEMAKDTNYSTYITVGIWCHYLATGDKAFLEEMWVPVQRCIEFALSLQQPTGEIHWGCDDKGSVWTQALIASSSCTWLSLRCAVRIARVLGEDRPDWEEASVRLAGALHDRPELFDESGFKKCNYAVSWFYPVLCGVINGDKGKERLVSRWEEFVIDGRGCKCVVEEPWWVTVGETSELAMALVRVGEREKAARLMEWIMELQDQPGSFWAGIKVPEEIVWPDEKPTWISAGVIIAASAYLDEKNRLAAVLWGKFEE